MRSPFHLSSASCRLVAYARTTPSAVSTVVSLVLLLYPSHGPSCHSDSILSLRSFCSRICLHQTFSLNVASGALHALPLLRSQLVLPSLPTMYLEAIIAAHLIIHWMITSSHCSITFVFPSICSFSTRTNSLTVFPASSPSPFILFLWVRLTNR